jgi:hypothetical protein
VVARQRRFEGSFIFIKVRTDAGSRLLRNVGSSSLDITIDITLDITLNITLDITLDIISRQTESAYKFFAEKPEENSPLPSPL